MIDSVLTATIAAVVIVALYALNRRFLAMKCPHCGKVVSIRGKATFICDRCHEERSL
jgi:ribosomal protein S27E